MAAKTVLNYLPRKSVIHELTGTTKLAFFLLVTVASMITYNTWGLLGLMAVSFAAFRMSHIQFREVRFMMVFMLVFLLLNNLFIFLFDPNQGTALYGTRHVLCHLFWRYDVTAEQLFYMLNISLKYFVALPVAILFISATNPSEFAASLNSIGISYKVGYSVAIALRYIPDIQRDYHNISQAQQARGVELGKSEPFFARLKNSVSILLPLILTSLNRIDVISNAMELRGFGKNKKRTWYTRRPFARNDWVAIGLGMVLLLISLTVTIRFGRFYNPFV
ncbi:MAG: energy-coupling factor transporter transmembrane component T [Gemmiger sp.]|nr:energy-coupling factor transporter transmembrane component T [Gemmiger sp.]MDY5782442.1 energy-coupling factor transporter transmembrane component T [Gemmiger sp.]